MNEAGLFAQIQQWLALGGPVMLILLALSISALTLVIAKVWEFHDRGIGRRDFVDPALKAWHDGRTDKALAILKAQPSPLADVMAQAMQGCSAAHARIDEVREQIAQIAADRLETARGWLRALEVIGTLAPLLGLLGTVLGMIEAFQRLQAAGDQVDPAILSGGIWEALLTTAAGLAIAIPTVAALNWLERRLERLHGQMQTALTRLFTRPLGSGGEAGAPGRQAGGMAVPLQRAESGAEA